MGERQIGGKKGNAERRKLLIKIVTNIYREVRENITSKKKKNQMLYFKKEYSKEK